MASPGLFGLRRRRYRARAALRRACPVCKGTLEEMSGQTEDSEEIDVEPRRFTVLKHRRHKYRCRCNGAIKPAPGPLRLIVSVL